MNNQADVQTGSQNERQMDKEVDRQINTQTYRLKCKQMNK
jgi:hypothetical protein